MVKYIHIQCDLKLANVDLGSYIMSWYTLLVPILFLHAPVGFSMQLLDGGHHSYISTGFGGIHYYPPLTLGSHVARKSARRIRGDNAQSQFIR